MTAINGCAEIKLPIPLKADVPAALSFPKPPVASPTASITLEIDFERLGNSPIICFNASFAPKVAPRIVLIPPKLFIADLVIFSVKWYTECGGENFEFDFVSRM